MGFLQQVHEFFCFHKKQALCHLLSQSLKERYAKPPLAVLARIIGPLITALIMYSFYFFILKIQTPHPFVFTMTGFYAWHFFSKSIISATPSIRSNLSFVSRVPLPNHIFPLVEILLQFFDFILILPFLTLLTLASGISFHWSVIFTPILLLNFLMITYSLSFLLSHLCVFFHDLTQHVHLLLRVGWFITPVLYHEQMIPESIRFLIFFNPLHYIFTHFHAIFLGENIYFHLGFVVMTIWSLSLLVITLKLHQAFGKALLESV